MWIVLSETINMLRNLQKIHIFGVPREFYHSFIYIVPSSDHSLLTLNMPFKVMLKRFEVVFMFGVKMLHFWRLINIHFINQYYTMALKCRRYNVHTEHTMSIDGLSDVTTSNECKVDSKYCSTIVRYRLMKWLVTRSWRKKYLYIGLH